MSRRFTFLMSLTLVAACGESNGDPFNGPVQLAIDPITNHQTSVVVRDSLDRTVDAVLWRGKGPLSRIRFVTPLYAQTAVDGAPVVGALVNAVPVGECRLEPWNPTAITDADGKARFFFDPGTKAGVCMAEIRYTDGETRLVTDTAIAVVEPGPPAEGWLIHGCGGLESAADTIDIRTYDAPGPAVVDEYDNEIPWHLRRFQSSALFTIRGDSVTLAALPAASGLDSVQVVVGGQVARTAYVYVRHPEIEATMLVYLWVEPGCGDYPTY